MPRLRQMQLGTNFNRPTPIEVECAEALLGVLPHAEMVKFAKDGSTVVSAAVKLARAHTGRVKVAILRGPSVLLVQRLVRGNDGIPGGIPAEAGRGYG